MKYDLDLHLLQRIDRELPYLTLDAEEIACIAQMLEWKLVEGEIPDKGPDGQYASPAIVRRMRPRGSAALKNGGDTLI